MTCEPFLFLTEVECFPQIDFRSVYIIVFLKYTSIFIYAERSCHIEDVGLLWGFSDLPNAKQMLNYNYHCHVSCVRCTTIYRLFVWFESNDSQTGGFFIPTVN